MGDNDRFDCIFVHLRGLQLQDSDEQEDTRRKHFTHRCLCVMTRWEPGVRRESFIQGVKMARYSSKTFHAQVFVCDDTLGARC